MVGGQQLVSSGDLSSDGITSLFGFMEGKRIATYSSSIMEYNT